jgi:hypothetical protein
MIIGFREADGKNDSVPLSDPILSSIPLIDATQPETVEEVNVLGERMRLLWTYEKGGAVTPGRTWLYFKPFEPKFIRLIFPETRRIKF